MLIRIDKLFDKFSDQTTYILAYRGAEYNQNRCEGVSEGEGRKGGRI